MYISTKSYLGLKLPQTIEIKGERTYYTNEESDIYERKKLRST